MKTFSFLAVLVAGSLSATAADQKPDCRPPSQALANAIKGKPVEEMLKALEKEFSSSPQCSCELIRSAIIAYKPTPHTVAAMVDSAINAAPGQKELIITCALVAAPDAEAEILAIAQALGIIPNPLDFPGLFGQAPNGQWIFSNETPIFVNPPPGVTDVNPSTPN